MFRSKRMAALIAAVALGLTGCSASGNASGEQSSQTLTLGAFLAPLKTAKAVDATTLELTLSAPDPAFLNYLSKDASFMQSPKSFGNADIATNPVGSGPYMLDTAATVTGTSYTYKSNPDYWAK